MGKVDQYKMMIKNIDLLLYILWLLIPFSVILYYGEKQTDGLMDVLDVIADQTQVIENM